MTEVELVRRPLSSVKTKSAELRFPSEDPALSFQTQTMIGSSHPPKLQHTSFMDQRPYRLRIRPTAGCHFGAKNKLAVGYITKIEEVSEEAAGSRICEASVFVFVGQLAHQAGFLCIYMCL